MSDLTISQLTELVSPSATTDYLPIHSSVYKTTQKINIDNAVKASKYGTYKVLSLDNNTGNVILTGNYITLNTNNVTINRNGTGSLNTATDITAGRDIYIANNLSTGNTLTALSARVINAGINNLQIDNNLTVANIITSLGYITAPKAIFTSLTSTNILSTNLTATNTLISTLTALNSIIGNSGFYSISAFNGAYTDGIITDYVTGLGRITVGPNDSLGFYNGGPLSATNSVYIQSNGNIGIGTTNPWSKLHIVTSLSSIALSGTNPTVFLGTDGVTLTDGVSGAGMVLLPTQTIKGQYNNLAQVGDQVIIYNYSTATVYNTAISSGLTFMPWVSSDNFTRGLRITNNGYVGINTAFPNQPLTVAGNISATKALYAGTDAYVAGNLTVTGSITALGPFTSINTLNLGASALYITNTGPGPALTVVQSGSYPIASFCTNTTANPIFKVDPSANFTTINTQISVGGTRMYLSPDGAGMFWFKTPNTREGVNSSNQNWDNGVSYGIQVSGNTDGISYPYTHMWCTSGFERMRINVNGNIGINTTTPNSTLHVVGSSTLARSGVPGQYIRLNTDIEGHVFNAFSNNNNAKPITFNATTTAIATTGVPVSGTNYISFQIRGTEAARIDTTSLTVQGTLNCSAINVQNHGTNALYANNIYSQGNGVGNDQLNFLGNGAINSKLATLTTDVNISGTQLSIFGVSGCYIDFSAPNNTDYNVRLGSFQDKNPYFTNQGISSGTFDGNGGFIDSKSSFKIFTGSTGTLRYTAPAFTITSGGYIGIGTTKPSSLLTVNGNISASGSIYVSAINVQSHNVNFCDAGSIRIITPVTPVTVPTGVTGDAPPETVNTKVYTSYSLTTNNAVSASGFRAIQGQPTDADASSNGYSFGLDGDTGMFSPLGPLSAAYTIQGGDEWDYYTTYQGEDGDEGYLSPNPTPFRNGVVAFYSNNVEVMRLGNETAIRGVYSYPSATLNEGYIRSSKPLVGIGTSKPNNTLTVNGTISATGIVSISALSVKDSTYPAPNSKATLGIGTFTTGAYVNIVTQALTDNSRIFITTQTPSGSVGTPFISKRNTTTHTFTVSSTNFGDRSTFAWFLIEPAS